MSEDLKTKRPSRTHTIGSVCKTLSTEFPDISISKIRYLEDQKLLNPKRTQGGYRVYSSDDIARLRTILRLQRDEFMPLRVIRQELASGRSESGVSAAIGSSKISRPTLSVSGSNNLSSLDEVVDQTNVDPKLVKELEDYGIISGETRAGVRYYNETDKEILRAVGELARYGVAGRNLRVFRSSADRESALIQQILAPSLRSRNPERRKEATEAVESLAAVVSHLKHLLLVRDLQKIVG